MRPIVCFALLGFAMHGLALHGGADALLSGDQIKMLQDSGGWKYITVSDADNGIQTKHTCFDGQPHPEECSGTLTFSPAKTFVQNVYIHRKRVQRHGTYELNGNQVSLYDELGTRDGPYTIHLDTQRKSLVLAMPQLRIELELEKEYRKALKTQPQSQL